MAMHQILFAILNSRRPEVQPTDNLCILGLQFNVQNVFRFLELLQECVANMVQRQKGVSKLTPDNRSLGGKFTIMNIYKILIGAFRGENRKRYRNNKITRGVSDVA
jgi:hypothetical protein